MPKACLCIYGAVTCSSLGCLCVGLEAAGELPCFLLSRRAYKVWCYHPRNVSTTVEAHRPTTLKLKAMDQFRSAVKITWCSSLIIHLYSWSFYLLESYWIPLEISEEQGKKKKLHNNQGLLQGKRRIWINQPQPSRSGNIHQKSVPLIPKSRWPQTIVLWKPGEQQPKVKYLCQWALYTGKPCWSGHGRKMRIITGCPCFPWEAGGEGQQWGSRGQWDRLLRAEGCEQVQWALSGPCGAAPAWQKGRSWGSSLGAGQPPGDAAVQAEMLHLALALTSLRSGKGVCCTMSQHLYRGFLFFSLSA